MGELEEDELHFIGCLPDVLVTILVRGVVAAMDQELGLGPRLGSDLDLWLG